MNSIYVGQELRYIAIWNGTNAAPTTKINYSLSISQAPVCFVAKMIFEQKQPGFYSFSLVFEAFAPVLFKKFGFWANPQN